MSDNDTGSFHGSERLFLEALEAINADLRIDEAIKNVLTTLNRLFESEMANVILLDQRSYLLKSFSYQSGAGDKVKAISLKCTEDLIGWHSANRGPVLVNDLESDPEFNATLGDCLDFKPKSLIGVPLFARGEFFGMLQIIRGDQNRPFDCDDLDRLAHLAKHIALSLRNSWILEEAIRGSREAKSLYEVGMALSSSLDLDELLEKILGNLLRVIDCNSAVIYLIDPKDNTINQVVGRGLPEALKEKLHLKLGQGITGRVAKTGQGVIVSDVNSDPDYIAFRPETRSEMAVPLKVGDHVIGAFNIESDKPGAYSEHDLGLLGAFASLAAVTIERARLYNERMASRRISDELGIARRIQMTFLPSQDPQDTRVRYLRHQYPLGRCRRRLLRFHPDCR